MSSNQLNAPVNARELRVFGIKRSGNHAIIRWLMNAHSGSIVHCNNIKGVDPYSHFEQIETRCISHRVCKNGLAARFWHYVKRYIRPDDRIVISRRDLHGTPESLRQYPQKALLVLSYENCSTDDPIHQQFEQRHDELVGTTGDRKDVLIIRDPANLFASMIRSRKMSESNVEIIQNLWIELGNRFLGENLNGRRDVIAINYNRWVESGDYRAEILEGLGLNGNRAALDEVPRYGAGSSFQGTAASGSGLQVFDRWQAYRNDPFFRLALSRPEIVNLSTELFGDEYGKMLSSLAQGGC